MSIRDLEDVSDRTGPRDVCGCRVLREPSTSPLAYLEPLAKRLTEWHTAWELLEVPVMRAYSLDLRTHLIDAVQAGVSKPDAARIFGVSVRTINRYLTHLAATDSLAAKPIPGRPRAIPPAQEPDLVAQLRAHPDATLAMQCDYWAASHQVRLDPSTLSRALARMGWTWEKTTGGRRARRGRPSGVASGHG